MSLPYLLIMTITDKPLKNEMNVHQFGMYLQEFKHLYTENEYYQLQEQWHEEYMNYLMDMVRHKKGEN